MRSCARAFELDGLSERYHALARVASGGDERPGRLVLGVLALGELERGLAGQVLDLEDRTARKVLSSCVDRGWLRSDAPEGAVRVGFPVEDGSWLFPDLFPQQGSSRGPRPLR